MKKVALGALIALVIGVVGLFTVGGNVFSMGKNANINEQETISANGIKTMKINVDVGEVRIREGESDQIDIKLHGSVAEKLKDQIKFKVVKSETKVEVVVRESNKFFIQIPFVNSGLQSERILDVSIPKSLLDKLEVNTNVGEIDIEGVEPTELYVNSDVGEIYVNQYSGNGNYVTDVGDIELKNISGKTKAETDTGDIDIALTDMKDDLELRSDIGELKVTFAEEPGNIEFDLNSELGDVSISGFKGYKDSDSRSIITQIGTNGPTLKATTEIGDISVKR